MGVEHALRDGRRAALEPLARPRPRDLGDDLALLRDVHVPGLLVSGLSPSATACRAPTGHVRSGRHQPAVASSAGRRAGRVVPRTCRFRHTWPGWSRTRAGRGRKGRSTWQPQRRRGRCTSAAPGSTPRGARRSRTSTPRPRAWPTRSRSAPGTTRTAPSRRRRRPSTRSGSTPRRRSARRCCSSSRTRSMRTRRTSPLLEARDVGKPISVSSADIPFISDNLRFFAGAARHLEGKSAGEYEKGFTSMIRREPLGVTVGHLPVELPADDGDLEDRPRPRGGQHLDHQAGRAHAAHHAAAGRALAGHPAARCVQRGHRATGPRSATSS